MEVDPRFRYGFRSDLRMSPQTKNVIIIRLFNIYVHTIVFTRDPLSKFSLQRLRDVWLCHGGKEKAITGDMSVRAEHVHE